MAKTINTNIDDGFLLFTFTNKQGEVFSSFKLNPTDINVAARAEELETFFEQAQESVKNVSSSKEMAEINKQIEDKINYMLGYEASKDYSKNQLPQQLFLEMVRCLPISSLTKSMKHLLQRLKRERKKCRKWSISTRRSIQNDRL